MPMVTVDHQYDVISVPNRSVSVPMTFSDFEGRGASAHFSDVCVYVHTVWRTAIKFRVLTHMGGEGCF